MPVRVHGQFQRSVHLVRDFYSARGLEGYVVTAKARETLGQIADALETPGASRAWSVFGPYGGGKSSFALFASRLLRRDADAHAHLGAADDPLADRLREASGGAFCPVLVVGSRGPVLSALADGLGRAMEAFAADVPKGKGRKADTSAAALALAERVRQSDTEAEVMAAYDEAAALVHARTGGGLFLVLDELGKHLEYAAVHPDAGDLYVLQLLAERAAAPGAPPLLAVTVLHQAFERYATGLSSSRRDEWRKVQGRYADVGWVEPVGETLRLLAAAIDADDRPADEPARLAEATVEAATLPARMDAEQVRAHLAEAWPLHPAVALLVGPLFRRLAQNERSLFSFLASGEPGSFLAVSAEGAIYRPDHLYDYLTGTLGVALAGGAGARLWAETEAALSRIGEDEMQERLLKQVAVLSFAGALAGLPPSERVLLATSGASEAETRAALGALREARAVAYRPFHDEYRVWEGSDFDLSAALAEAREAIPGWTPLAELLRQSRPPQPLVARRHAFETGTSRVFEVVYSDGTDLARLLAAPPETDGRVVYVLPDEAPTAELFQAVRQSDARTLVALVRGLGGLRDLARDLACLDWVRAHTDSLAGDRVARQEVDAQHAALGAEVDARVAEALAPEGAAWFRAGEPQRVDALQPALSAVCDDVFPHTPRIWNELVNRHAPSSSAVRATKGLLRAMTEHPHEPRLGIEGTPAEYGIYASVLQRTGLHRETAAGWRFASPTEPGTEAAIGALDAALREARTAPVGVPALYDRLRQPPYGVRDGLLPILLFSQLVRHGDRVAVFENGVFQQRLSYEAVERLLRGPADFTVQWVEATEAQQVALRALGARVGLAEPAGGHKPLPVVARVLGGVSALPPYVRKTTTMSDQATQVRETLVRAKEPASLLFRELPLACGVEPFEDEAPETAQDRATVYVQVLGDALAELSRTYDDLLTDLDRQLAEAFGLRSASREERRSELGERARALAGEAVDGTLRAFIVRAGDELLDARGWLESIGALLTRRPPNQWGDEDRARFATALGDVARTFAHREAVAFTAEAPAERTRHAQKLRIGVTATHEEEREAVVHVHPEDAETVRQLAASMLGALGDADVDVQLAALGQLSLALLERRAGRSGDLANILASLSDPSPDA